MFFGFFFQAEDGIGGGDVTGVQACAVPIGWLVCRVCGVRFAFFFSCFCYFCGVGVLRSDERRVGKECRSPWPPCPQKKKN